MNSSFGFLPIFFVKSLKVKWFQNTYNKAVARHTWQEKAKLIKLNGNLRVQIGAFELQTPLAHLMTFFPTNWYSLAQVTLATKTLPDSLIMFTIPFSTSGWMHRPVK